MATEMVLIERCYDPRIPCQVIEDLHPDLLQWFAQDPSFRQVFSAYQFERTDARFDIYRRRD